MEKKTTMTEALKYLNVEMLYGTIAGLTVKDYLVNNVENIIKGDWSPDETASRIKEAMISKDTGETLYTPAYERAALPIGAALEITEKDKENYINTYIQSLPYTGDLRIGPNSTINIAEQLKGKLSLMDDEYMILFDFDGNKRSLKDEYRILLDNEYKPPTRLDKIEVVMEGVRRLRDEYPDFDAISEIRIDGKTFTDAIKDFPNKMNDQFCLVDSFGELATDEMYRIFKKYAEARYNSINSKPANVETISVGRNSDTNELEVTSEYVFMGDDEIKSVSSQKQNDEQRLRKNMLNILEGIRLAKSIDALEEYEEMIAVTWEEIKSLFPEYTTFRFLYERTINEYTAKQEELSMIKNNEDDAEILLRNELREIKTRIEGIKTDFYHTYDNPQEQLESIRYDFSKFRDKAEGMNARIHHEIQDVEDLLRSISIKVQYSMENVNHMVKAKKQDLDDLMSQAYFSFRRLDNAQDYREKAACQAKCEDLARELERKLEDYFKEGFITDSDYENYLHDMNKKLYSVDMEPIRRRA